MLTLYAGGGAWDFEILEYALDDQEYEERLMTAGQILRARGEELAVEYLERLPFRVAEGTNDFGDEFHLLVASIPLTEYEDLRKVARQSKVKHAFQQIAKVVTEIGTYIRFIAIDVKPQPLEYWDVFICHAGEDKENVVMPLYTHLISTGIRCWVDRGEILWGDSIVGKINEGLSSSRFVIVVISPALIEKGWPTKEMNVALSQEIDSGVTRVLPLMVGSDPEIQQMLDKLAVQRDKRYLRWTGDPQEIEKELRALIRRDNTKGKT